MGGARSGTRTGPSRCKRRGPPPQSLSTPRRAWQIPAAPSPATRRRTGQRSGQSGLVGRERSGKRSCERPLFTFQARGRFRRRPRRYVCPIPRLRMANFSKSTCSIGTMIDSRGKDSRPPGPTPAPISIGRFRVTVSGDNSNHDMCAVESSHPRPTDTHGHPTANLFGGEGISGQRDVHTLPRTCAMAAMLSCRGRAGGAAGRPSRSAAGWPTRTSRRRAATTRWCRPAASATSPGTPPRLYGVW